MSVVKEAYQKLCAERDAIQAKSAPLHSKRNEILSRLRTVEAELKGVEDQIKEVEGPRLYDVSVEAAALARLLDNHVKAPVQE